MTASRGPVSRVVTLIALLAAVLSGMTLVAATPAAALGPGEVCAFIEPDGGTVLGNNFGHIGWGFLVAGSSSWIYGATENPNGTYQINAPGFNGAWKAQGTWTDMINDFTRQYDYPSHSKVSGSNSPYPAHPYTEYKCELTSGSAVGAAITAATNNISAGYTGLGNNCLDATYRVLNAYGAPNLPWPSTHPRPYQDWYSSLDSSTWNITGKLGATWTNRGSGLKLDVSGPSTADGAIVHQWTYTGADNQWWIDPWQADGYTRLFSRYSGKCLGISGGSTAAGAQAVQWTCDGSANQSWYLESTGSSAVEIVDRGSGLCLSVAGGSGAVGAAVVQEPCDGGAAQEWS